MYPMHPNQYGAITGFPVDSWEEITGGVEWAVPEWASGFKEGTGVTLSRAMFDGMLRKFPTTQLPGEFPAGLSLGRALLEARYEFLERDGATPLGVGGTYRTEDDLHILMNVTSLGKPCAQPTIDDLWWLLWNLPLLCDVAPQVVPQDEGLGVGGTILRTYLAALPEVPTLEDGRKNMLRLFRPLGAPDRIQAALDPKILLNDLFAISSRVQGLGLAPFGEPFWNYWEHVENDSLHLLQTLSHDDWGVPGLPMMVRLEGNPPRLSWLPMSEDGLRIQVRLEVVAADALRHRAQVTRDLPDEMRGKLPSTMVVLSLDYLSPLRQRCEGVPGPFPGGTTQFLGHGSTMRQDFEVLARGSMRHRHPVIAGLTESYLKVAGQRGALGPT